MPRVAKELQKRFKDRLDDAPKEIQGADRQTIDTVPPVRVCVPYPVLDLLPVNIPAASPLAPLRQAYRA
ncbi:hypothetical protein GCM10009077_22270 [Roseibium denhamense]